MCLLRRRRALFRVAKCALAHGALGLVLAGCAMTALPPQAPSPAWVGAPRGLSDAEQEAVIAAAIAEHEIRQH